MSKITLAFAFALALLTTLSGSVGSSFAQGPLPRTPLIGQAPAAAPYNPPPISNPSAQISQFNQSFQFNRGLGNNPTDRDAYLRYNFNNR